MTIKPAIFIDKVLDAEYNLNKKKVAKIKRHKTKETWQ